MCHAARSTRVVSLMLSTAFLMGGTDALLARGGRGGHHGGGGRAHQRAHRSAAHRSGGRANSRTPSRRSSSRASRAHDLASKQGNPSSSTGATPAGISASGSKQLGGAATNPSRPFQPSPFSRSFSSASAFARLWNPQNLSGSSLNQTLDFNPAAGAQGTSSTMSPHLDLTGEPSPAKSKTMQRIPPWLYSLLAL
jgi:hypothetical protein